MQDEFEKKIRERLQAFGIQPAPEVWEEVGSILQKKGRRRVFVGWWILLGLVVLGGMVFLGEKDTINRQRLNQQEPVTTDTTVNSTAQAPLHAVTDSAITKSLQAEALTSQRGINGQKNEKGRITYIAKKTLRTGDVTNANNNETGGTNKRQRITNGQAVTGADKSVRTIGADAQQSNTQIIANTLKSKGGEKATAPPEATAVNEVSSAKKSTTGTAGNTFQAKPGVTPRALPNAGTDTSINILTSATDSTATNNTARLSKPVGRPKTVAGSSSQWFFTFSAGTTQTATQGQFNTFATGGGLAAATGYAASIAALPGITSPNAFSQYNIAQPGVGFHVSAGGLYERKLSRRWKISAGLGFSYLENTQKTGTKYNYPYYVSANYTYSLTQSIALQSYYEPGSSGTVVNKAWQLQIPFNVGYTINPAAKTRLVLTAGVSFAWLFTNQWLIPDTRYGKLYYSNTAFNSKAINWQVGPAFELHNNWQVGLQYQRSFTTLAKSYITPKLYWQNIGVYTAIPLGRKGSGKKGKRPPFGY